MGGKRDDRRAPSATSTADSATGEGEGVSVADLGGFSDCLLPDLPSMADSRLVAGCSAFCADGVVLTILPLSPSSLLRCGRSRFTSLVLPHC